LHKEEVIIYSEAKVMCGKTGGKDRKKRKGWRNET